MNTRWLPVPGYEGFYEVSSDGQFRRTEGGRGAVAGRPVSNRRLNVKGYIVVEFCRNDIKRRFLAHQIVARAFLGDPSVDEVVNHKNGVKTDNQYLNLEWVTRAENNKHAARIGLLRPMRGEKNGRAVLNENQVRIIRQLNGIIGQRKLAALCLVSKSTIQFIHQGKHWAHKDTSVHQFPEVNRG